MLWNGRLAGSPGRQTASEACAKTKRRTRSTFGGSDMQDTTGWSCALDAGVVAETPDPGWYRIWYCARNGAIAAQKNKLKPRLVKSWCIPEVTAEFLRKMEHILWLYALPDDLLHPLVCFDEKSIQLLLAKSLVKTMNTSAMAHAICLCL